MKSPSRFWISETGLLGATMATIAPRTIRMFRYTWARNFRPSRCVCYDLVRHHRANDGIFLYAFDLIELNGDDLRRDPLEGRKATLEMMLTKAGPGIRFNEHIEGEGETVFRHACKLGLEGIVSKRKGSLYRSGRSPDWLKMKNANAPAVKREEEEDWARDSSQARDHRPKERTGLPVSGR